MSKRHERKRHSYRRIIERWIASYWAVLSENPSRTATVGVVSLVSLWLVLTKSLPYALAPGGPDAALALNPNNPVALLVKAEQLRGRLVEITSIGAEKTKGTEEVGREERANTLSNLPEAKESGDEPLGEREILRGQIRDLALRALANDPMNARAYRSLAEVIGGADQVRLLMQEAFKRSRREATAAFWLLNDSYYHNDFKAVLYYSDMLLRTRPELHTYIYGYLSHLAAEPESRSLLVERLAAEPAWRQQFFEVFPRTSENTEAPLLVMTALRDAGSPVSIKELAPYLSFLIRTDRIDVAYNAWLQFLTTSQLEKVELLTNRRFESPPSGLPFDWEIGPGINATADIVPLARSSVGNALHIKFGEGRVKFPEVSQVLLLPPGRYRLDGKARGAISGKRGLRWQVICTSGAHKIIGETEMLLGQSLQWRIFTLYADVPQLQECHGETVRLIHDSRSASEELASGEVWFSDLRFTRVLPDTAQWTPAQ